MLAHIFRIIMLEASKTTRMKENQNHHNLGITHTLLGNGEPCQKIFLPISNQPTNRYLKDIMADLKIDKTMTFHRARHSFRTIAAKKGIRDGIAERIMGHAEGNDIKDIYTHLHDEDIVKEMRDKWVI